MTSEAAGSAPAGAEPMVDISLQRLPLRVAARATEHYQDLFREFALLAASTPQDSDTVPARLLAVIDALGRRYPPQNSHDEERAAAMARGEIEADMRISVPPSAAAASQALDALLDDADQFCRSGELLTLAAPPDAVAYRRWYIGEVVAQVNGEAPTPWSGGLD